MNSIAVIGAGPAGLATAKSLGERGLKPTIFDSSAEVGGMWISGRGPTWEGMRTNLSKHTCSFSDLRHSSSASEFPTVPEMNDYLNVFAARFGIINNCRLGSRVTSVTQENERWKLDFKSADGGEMSEDFDGVVVASGYFSSPGAKSIAGLEQFGGEVLHSSQYRNRDEYRGKRVVVIGHGLSGVEIASDLCGAANSVVHLFRTPSWVIPRYLCDPDVNGKIRLDLVFYRRKDKSGETDRTAEERNRARNRYLSSLSQQNELGRSELTIEPHDSKAFPVAISDRYVEFVSNGSITPMTHKAIASCDQSQIKLDDGRTIYADVVVLATGYRFELPFLNSQMKSLFEFEETDPLQAALLYRTILPPGVQGLGFVGAYKGPFWGAMELQARFLGEDL